MDKACGNTIIVTVPAGTAAQQHAEPEPPDLARRTRMLRAAYAFGVSGRLAVLAAVAYSLVYAARLVSDRKPRDLALLAGGYAALAALLLALLRRGRQFADPDYRGGEGRWLAKAAWDLVVDVLVFVFVFRVADLVPPAVSVLVWCATAILACGMVYVLAFHDDGWYRDVYGDDAAAAAGGGGDSKAIEKITSADEKV